MLVKLLSVLVLSLTCPVAHAADCYRRGEDMKPYLHSIVLKIAAMNLSCKVDADCTYESKAGGFVVAKDKLYVVKDCFRMVSASMCQNSINPKTQHASYNMENPLRELDMPTFLNPPNQVRCIKQECRASEDAKPATWKSMWASVDKAFRAPGPVCWGYVKDPLKDYNRSI